MKQFTLLMLLLVGSVVTFGQSLNDVNELLGKNKDREAKAAIDKFLSDPKNAANSEGWYYKGRVYNALSRDSSLGAAESLQLKRDAFEAFKKNQQLDPKDTRMKLELYVSYFDLYNGFFDIGGKGFNTRDYSNAFEAFKSASSLEDYVRAKGYDYNGFKFPSFDTALTLNIALSARQAKNTEQAIVYYRKLADIGVNGEQNMDIYAYLIEEYGKANNTAEQQAVIAKAQQVYPQTDWQQEMVNNELDKVVKIEDKNEALVQYDALYKKYPTNYLVAYYYSTELYNSLYASETKPKDTEKTKAQLTETLKTAIANDKDKGIDANLLMARYLYNSAIDYDDSSKKYNGPKPDMVKKKAEFKAMYNKKVDEAIPYAETVVKYYADQPKLKAVQKANYKIMLDILSQLYGVKGDKAKSDDYSKRKDAVDKL